MMTDEKFDFQYPISITKDQWLDLLKDRTVISRQEYSFLEAVYLSPGHRNRAKELTKILELSDHRTLNRYLGPMSRKIKAKTDYVIKINKKDGTKHAWCVPFYANHAGNGFEWVLRPELIQAFNEIYEGQVKEDNAINETRGDPLWEGKGNHLFITRYERNQVARKMCLEIHGYSCVVCTFNFEEFYGEAGKGRIHVHHLTLISERKGDYIVNPEQDLVPVCPNCHYMIHTKTPPYKIEQLKKMIERI